MYYEVNVKFSWIEENKNGTKEKSSREVYLVECDSVEYAQNVVHKLLANTNENDFEIVGVKKTKYTKLIQSNKND
jgi:hypothetical protein